MPENFSISNRPSHPIDTFMDKLEDLDHKDYTISNVSMKFFKDEDGHIYLDKTDQGRLKAQMECSFTLLDNQTNEEKTIVFKQNIYGGKALKEDALDRDKIGEQNKFLYAIKTFRKICLKESLINQSVEDLLDPSNSDFKSLKSASKVKKVTITLNYDNKDQIIEGHVKGKAFSNKKFMGDQNAIFK